MLLHLSESYYLHNLCLILFLKYWIKLSIVAKVCLCFDLCKLPHVTGSSLIFQ